MKLKYILSSLVAVCALAIGCTKEQKVTLLDEIQVSQSIVSVGKTNSIEVKAEAEWKIETEIPSWLKVSPLNGPAGTSKITFEAGEPSTKPYNSVTLSINCKGKTQLVLVQMGEPKPINDKDHPFTADEAIAYFKANGGGAEFYVKGVVRIASIDLNYGNAEFYLEENDPEYDFEFYRCMDLDNKKFTDSEKVKAGDVIVGYGAITSYKQTIEFAQGCYLVKIEKSEIELKNAAELNGEKDGGVVQAKLVVKGGDLKFNVMADWMSVKSIENIPATYDEKGKEVTPAMSGVNILLQANNGAPRSGEISFTSGKSTISATVNQAGADVAIKDIELNQPCFVIGQVTAICARGFILTDNTASVLYYKSSGFDPTAYKIGDKYAVQCTKVTSYGGAYQLDATNVTSLEKVSEGRYTYPAPEVMDKVALDSYVALTTNDFGKLVKFTAKASISGSYYNFFFNDGDTNGFSLYQGTDAQKALFTTGTEATVTGYLISRSSSKYGNVVVVSVE